ncbi:helix-turn-helix domain-containing protein [Rhizobium sp. CNPSo 4039]|nr:MULTISPECIES: helix-turn-helix domain-containing protein [unclassified Rhizobium]ASW09739.1 hypothetical protein CKA34_27290 [Rhizobium sp. 11515TR]MDK4717664.1 helix-turn-helix domain-containing protein [Rhizobium sp. CNPSo 4039]
MALPQGELGAIASFHFATAGIDAPFDAWRSLLSIIFESAPSKASSPSNFHADLMVHHFGSFLLCRTVTGSGRYRRTETTQIRDDIDHIVISSCVRGVIALADPASRRLRQGDVAIFDLSAPAAFAMTAAEGIHLILPRTLLPASLAPVYPTACRILARDTAMAIFIRGILDALMSAVSRLTSAEAIALGGSVPNLLASCLGPAAPSAETKGDLGRRLRRHIEDNLHHSDLTLSRLTRDLGVSRSQLYRQFGATGGVEAYIRRRRLRRCLLILCDARHADRRIGDIAYEMGFTDEAHFSRLFRRLFGLSPRSARNAARGDSSDLSGLLWPAGGGSFGSWLTSLTTG